MLLPPTTLLLMGIQGAGKGTQGDLLHERHGYIKLAMGDLLRAEAEKGTARGAEIKQIIENGQLVPDEVSTSLLLDEIRQLDKEQRLIIDAHPRTLPQAKLLLDGLQQLGRSEWSALFITLTEDEAMTRLLERGRVDDTPEKIQHRLAWSRSEMMPVAQWFATQGRLQEVDGTGSVEDVFERIEQALQLA